MFGEAMLNRGVVLLVVVLLAWLAGCDDKQSFPTEAAVPTGSGGESLGNYVIQRLDTGHKNAVAILGSWVQAHPDLKIVSVTHLSENNGSGSSGTVALLVVAFRDAKGERGESR